MAPRYRVNFAVSDQGIRKDPNRGAHRDLYQKTTAFESSHRDQGGRDPRVHAGVYRPAGKAALALRGLPTAMFGGSRYSQRARVARSVHAEAAIETALPTAPGEVSPLRCAGGRLSMGRAVGASDRGVVQCRVRAGAGVELEGHGARIRTELE